MDVAKYIYRREFGLSAEELEMEPADQFFLNLKIYAEIRKKERLEAEHG